MAIGKPNHIHRVIIKSSSYWVKKEYVASLIGLYKNDGAVLYVGNFFLVIYSRYTAKTQQHVIFTLLCNCIGFFHGQILIETATHSCPASFKYAIE